MNSKHIFRLVSATLLCAPMVSAIGCVSEKAAAGRSWVEHSRAVAQQRLGLTADLPTTAEGLRTSPALGSTGSQSPSVWPIELRSFQLAAERTAGAETKPADVPRKESSGKAGREWRAPLPSFAETVKRDVLELPATLWDDTKRVYTNPWNLVFLLGAGGASVALRPEVDDDIEDYYDEHHTFTEDWRDAFGAAGNPLVHFGMAGVWYLTGQLAQDAKTYDVGTRLFRALTINGISTVLLKTAACTESPNGEDWAWPSGHVSSSMVVATVMNDAYGPLVGVPLFGLTGLVAVERLDDREHHFSDVIFGAALGWVVAETVMKDQPPEIAGGHLVPYVDPVGRNAGVAWVKSIGER